MFPSRKVSDTSDSVSEVLTLSYGVAAQQRCTVKAYWGVFSQLYVTTTALSRPGGWFCSLPQDGLAQQDYWLLGQLSSWECGATKPLLQLEEFKSCNRKLQPSQSSSQSWRLSCDANPSVAQSPRMLLCWQLKKKIWLPKVFFKSQILCCPWGYLGWCFMLWRVFSKPLTAHHLSRDECFYY